MDIDQNGLRYAAARVFLERRVERRERIVKGPLHEDLTEGLRDKHLSPARVFKKARAPPRRVLGKVEGAQHTRL